MIQNIKHTHIYTHIHTHRERERERERELVALKSYLLFAFVRIHIVNQIPITRLSTYKGRYYSIEHLNEEGNPHTNKRM